MEKQSIYNRKNDIKRLKKKYIILPDCVQYKDKDNLCQAYEMFGMVDETKPCYLNCYHCFYE
jgi:hypothetical protein